MSYKVSRTFHLDKRVDSIRATDPKSDDLLTTAQTAKWLGVSINWLENNRTVGNGPPFRKLSDRVIKYHRGEVMRWLDKRKYTSTKQYTTKKKVEAVG